MATDETQIRNSKMSEPVQKNLPPQNASGAAQPGTAAGVAGESAVQPAAVPAAAAQSPAAFGGHRGGGKKRLDGLPAGSPEAKEASLKADAERQRVKRAAKKIAALPPPLPGVLAAAQNKSDALAGGGIALPAAVAGVALAPGVAPAAVPWLKKTLERPAKLFTKILDRLQAYRLTRRIRAIKLEKKDEDALLEAVNWNEGAMADFTDALAETATVELNKRRIGGAENSHLISLAMTGGALVLSHSELSQRIAALELKAKKVDAAADAAVKKN
jgi:hypothetical protein